jgi:hypothetical protein
MPCSCLWHKYTPVRPLGCYSGHSANPGCTHTPAVGVPCATIHPHPNPPDACSKVHALCQHPLFLQRSLEHHPNSVPCMPLPRPHLESLGHNTPERLRLPGLRLKLTCRPSTDTVLTSSCRTRLTNSLKGTLMTSVSLSPRPSRPPRGHRRMRKNSMSRLRTTRIGC